jgi:AraC family transcriptional regulator
MSRRSPTIKAISGWVDVELLPPGPYHVRYCSDRTVIGVALDRQRGVHSFSSDRVRRFDAWPNSLAITPQGMETFSESSAGGEYVRILLDSDSVLHDCLLTNISISAGERISREGDRRAGILARRIRRAMLACCPEDEDIESLCVQLLQSSGLLSEDRWRTRESGPAGDRPQLARVLDFAASNFGGPLPLHTLARVADMSLYRFLRSFSATIGMTPHAWIVDQRLQKARMLIENNNAGLADIAISCGFSSQSHMTEVFSRLIGISPARYERDIEVA